MSLNAPLPGEKPNSVALAPADAEADGQMFLAAMAQVQGGA